MKAFADNKTNVTEKQLIFAFGRTENFLGNGENAGYSYFLLILQCFQKSSSSGLL